MKNTTNQKPTYQMLLKKCKPILQLRILQIIENIKNGNLDKAFQMQTKITKLMVIDKAIEFDKKFLNLLELLIEMVLDGHSVLNSLVEKTIQNAIEELSDFVVKNAKKNELIRFSQTG